MLDDLYGLIKRLEAGHRRADDECFWRELNVLLARQQQAEPATLETALQGQLAGLPEGVNPTLVLGACWELLERRVAFRTGKGADCRRERQYRDVFERLLEQGSGLEAVLRRLDGLDAGRARWQVRMTVEPAANTDPAGAVAPGDPFRLRLEVEADAAGDRLAVYVLQRDATGRWSLLFPNCWDFRASWLVPGVAMWIPEAGGSYRLEAPERPGPCLLKAIVTHEPIEIPNDYVPGVTRWTGRQGKPADGDLLPRYLEKRRAALSELCEGIARSPGRFAIAHASLPLRS